MSGGAAAWVHVPVAQQAGGMWIDEVWRERLAETPLVGMSVPPEAPPRQRIEVVRGVDAGREVDRLFYQRGWTDGLPIVPPTLARVAEMVRWSALAGDSVLAELDPLKGQASVERVAANAVMAGCRPEYFPLVLAAVKGIADPTFNLRGVSTTDENVAPLMIVSGPLAAELGINGGLGALGPGWQANATIGRALRLIMSNIGGGWPGLVSLAGIGQPARYTLCVAENHAASPWAPLHADVGMRAEDSALTLLRAESCINVTGELEELASVMGSAASAFSMLHGGHVAVLVAPATARRLAGAGWSKADVASYLFEHGRIAPEQWRQLWVRRHIGQTYAMPDWIKRAEIVGGAIPVVESPRNIIVFVAGGEAPIAQQVYFPSWGFPACRLTMALNMPANWQSLVE